MCPCHTAHGTPAEPQSSVHCDAETVLGCPPGLVSTALSQLPTCKGVPGTAIFMVWQLRLFNLHPATDL